VEFCANKLDPNMSDQQVHHFLADGTQLSAMDDYDPKRSSNASRGSIGRASGVTNYTPDKLQIMLESVAEVIPTTDEEWDLVSQKFNKVFQEDRQVKSLKRKFNELVSGGTKTTSHDLTAIVWWAKKLSLRIREKTTGKPYSEPMQSTSYADIENAYRAGGHHEDDDSEAKDPMSWTGPPGAMPLASPSLAPRIRKNKMSSGGGDYQQLMNIIEMQGNANTAANQQIMSMLQQVLNILGAGHDQQQQQHLMQGLVDTGMLQPTPMNVQHVGGKAHQNGGGRRKTAREEMEEAEAAKRARHEKGGN